MSSFFTAPASQRKRKRTGTSTAAGAEKPSNSKRRAREDSISSGESENEAQQHEDESDASSEGGDETAAERRLRLAERYLENVRDEVIDEAGFDAADIDRDLIAERLKEDVAETKGRLYRRIASDFDFSTSSHTLFRANQHATTAIATCAPYAYTVSKDMTLIKWEIPSPPDPTVKLPSNISPRRRPIQVAYTKGNKNKAGDPSFQHHTAAILCVAASPTGQFVATGGADKKLIIWRASDLTPLKVFPQHRDAVTAVAFRRGTNQLFSGSHDRTIKVWSLDELAYIETLFGHQDHVVDVAALAQERCVSVGARDRTARLWKVVEESQLVFRGGGSSITRTNRGDKQGGNKATGGFSEGSIDRIALVDEETFVTGSDNGALSLWSVNKKKPIFTVPCAHGLDPAMRPDEVSADADVGEDGWVPPQQPRWITALATIPYTDVVLSGSWDGWIRVWKVSADGRKLESLGVLGQEPSSGHQDEDKQADGDVEMDNSASVIGAAEDSKSVGVRGVVNGISIFERGERGRDGICVVAAVAKEMKLGRWRTFAGKNAAVSIEVRRTVVSDDPEDGDEGDEES
ncbi:small nucleolar ribonucleoprotein complex subunit [Saccharata proteae CBS 121410]|uniref:Small nucleolar ribonucleoprotein complex subunit n=1 Tax=Saccharata proteae CBS 121410 TaxID=1314787 RepID=A0A9P4M0X0_9PEZI|nr:small nucleolar ribonucleoprotein complex subunit [Saccharata proteae CBS 121410]